MKATVTDAVSIYTKDVDQFVNDYLNSYPDTIDCLDEEVKFVCGKVFDLALQTLPIKTPRKNESGTFFGQAITRSL